MIALYGRHITRKDTKRYYDIPLLLTEMVYKSITRVSSFLRENTKSWSTDSLFKNILMTPMGSCRLSFRNTLTMLRIFDQLRLKNLVINLNTHSEFQIPIGNWIALFLFSHLRSRTTISKNGGSIYNLGIC